MFPRLGNHPKAANGRSDPGQAIGQAAILQGYKVLYRETHVLLDELSNADAEGTRKEYMETIATVPLLIIELFSTLLRSNRLVEDWGKLLGNVAAISAMLDRLLHHGHVLKCGPRSWRTKTAATP